MWIRSVRIDSLRDEYTEAPNRRNVTQAVTPKEERVVPLLEEVRDNVDEPRLGKLSVPMVTQLIKELEEIATWYRLDYRRGKVALEPEEERT